MVPYDQQRRIWHHQNRPDAEVITTRKQYANHHPNDEQAQSYC